MRAFLRKIGLIFLWEFFSCLVLFWSFTEDCKGCQKTVAWTLTPLEASLQAVGSGSGGSVPDQGRKIMWRGGRNRLLLLWPWPGWCRKLKFLWKRELCVVKTTGESNLARGKDEAFVDRFLMQAVLAHLYLGSSYECLFCFYLKTDFEWQVCWCNMHLLFVVLYVMPILNTAIVWFTIMEYRYFKGSCSDV